MTRPSRLFGAPLMVVGARLRAQPGRALLVMVGIALALTMLVAIAGGSLEARDRAVQQAIGELPLSQRAFRVDLFNLPLGQDYAQADRTARSTLAGLGTARPLRGTFLRELRVGGGLVQLASIEGLDRIARLRSGRLPRSCDARRCEVVQIGPGTRARWSEGGIELVRVGTVALPDRAVFGDSLQAAAENNGERPTLLLAAGAAAFDRLPAFDGIYRAYSWVAPLDVEHVHVWQISRLLSRETRAQTRLSAVSDLYELSGPDSTLLDAQSRGRTTTERMVLIGGEIAALMLGFALVAAIGLRRGLANERRRLLQRGARAVQVEFALVAEVAAVTVLGVLVGVGLGVLATSAIAWALGQPAGEVLTHSLLTAAGLGIVAGAWLGATIAVFAVVRLSDDTARARRIRPLDVAAIGAVVVIVLELARGGLSADALASGGDPTLLVLLPGLTAFAVAVLVARLLGPLMRALERIGRTAPVALRLALLALARAPRRTVSVTVFLVVSFGLALFASTYRATLAQGADDQAAFSVPLDFTVTEGTQLVLPLDAAPISAYRRLGPGVRAYPIVRQLGTVPGSGTSAANPTVLGIPAAAVRELHWRSDYSGLSKTEIARRLSGLGTVSLRGVPLPAGTRTLTVTVRITGVALTLVLAAEDGNGRTVLLGLGDHGPGVHTLHVRLRQPGRLRQIDGLELSLSTAEQYGLSHREAEVGATSIPSGAMTVGPLRGDGRVLTAWQHWVTRGGASVRRTGSGTRLSYAFTVGQAIYFRPRQSTDGKPLPVVVSSDIASPLEGERTPTIDFGDIQLPARIVGVAARFPDSEQFGNGFVVADEATLSTAMNSVLPGRGDPLEVWLSAPASAVGGVAAALDRPPFTSLDVASRRTIQRRLAGDPLATAIELALTTAAVAALALAAIGFLVSLLSDLRDERGEFFDLEAQGVAPATLRRQFQLRALILAGLGLAGGVLLGLVLSILAVALIQVSAANVTPEPPLRLVPAWGLSIAAGALLLAVLCGLVELATRRAFREDVPRRATWSLE